MLDVFGNDTRYLRRKRLAHRARNGGSAGAADHLYGRRRRAPGGGGPPPAGRGTAGPADCPPLSARVLCPTAGRNPEKSPPADPSAHRGNRGSPEARHQMDSGEIRLPDRVYDDGVSGSRGFLSIVMDLNNEHCPQASACDFFDSPPPKRKENTDLRLNSFEKFIKLFLVFRQGDGYNICVFFYVHVGGSIRPGRPGRKCTCISG